MTISDMLCKFDLICAHLKAALIYRPLFGAFGKRSIIMKPVLVTHPRHIRIGDRVSIRQGARLEIVLDGVNRNPVLEIGSHTNIEQNVHIACHCRIVIGPHVSITANCAIVDITHPYFDVEDKRSIAARLDTRPSFVEIGQFSFIGIGSIILPNVRIGEHCVVGANSVVTKDVPAFSVVAGNPARIVKSYDKTTNTWKSPSNERNDFN